MKYKSIPAIFILIGVLIGIILTLQVRAQPVKIGSFPLDQYEVQKSLLNNFSSEQGQLKKRLAETEIKLKEARKVYERGKSRQTLNLLNDLRSQGGFGTVEGEGIRITLNDNTNVTRVDFFSTNEFFVQASDLRDLVNILFLKDARGISINGKRVMPLTPIQSVFDSIFIGNFQITSPFTIEAAGNPGALEEGVYSLGRKKIQISVNRLPSVSISPGDDSRTIKFLSLLNIK